MIARIGLAMLAAACLSLGQTIDSAGRGILRFRGPDRPRKNGIGLLQLIQPRALWGKNGLYVPRKPVPLP